jgi:hypothetical protein
MMEYAIMLIVIGLTVLFLATHFGAHLRARYGAMKATTDVTRIAPGTHVEVEDNDLTGTAKSVPGQ